MTGQRAHNFKDLVGTRKGRLTVLRLDTSKTRTKLIYWWVRCDCGTEKSVAATNLRPGGKVVSCGCYREERSKDRRGPSPTRQCPETRARKEVYQSYRKRAVRKLGVPFELTEAQFNALIDGDCVYCGARPANQIASIKEKKNHSYPRLLRYNGIDRKHNALGYTLENCVTCCAWCNRSKRTMDQEQFCAWVLTVAARVDQWFK